jgi:hypothetical protein
MSGVLDKIRKQYPAYQDVPDDTLMAAVVKRYPEYLENKDFQNDRDGKRYILKQQQAPLQAKGERLEKLRGAIDVAKDYFVEPTANPIRTLTSGMKATGRMAQGLATDVMAGNVLPSDAGIIPRLENTKAAMNSYGEALPYEANMTTVQKGLSDAARSAPPIAAGMVLQRLGVPAPAAFGGAMAGQTWGETHDPVATMQSGAVGMVIPAVGQAGQQLAVKTLASAVDKGLLSANRTLAHKAAEVLGSQGAIQAFIEGMNLPAYLEMEPEQRKEAIIRSMTANIAFLGMDLPYLAGKGPSATQGAIDPARQTSRKVGQLMQELVKNAPAMDSVRQVVDDYARDVLNPDNAQYISVTQPEPGAMRVDPSMALKARRAEVDAAAREPMVNEDGMDISVPLDPAPPKLRAMENQGDLMANQTEDFSLATEKGTDFERIQRAREQQVADQAEADSAQQNFLEPAAPDATVPETVGATETITGSNERTGSEMPAESGAIPDPSAPSRPTLADLQSRIRKLRTSLQRDPDLGDKRKPLMAKLAALKQQVKAGDYESPPAAPRKVRMSKREGYDLIDHLTDNIGKIDPALIRAANPDWKPAGALRKLFKKGGVPADAALMEALRGPYKGSDTDLTAFGDALDQVARARKGDQGSKTGVDKIIALEAKQAEQFGKRVLDGERPKREQKKVETVRLENLLEGDEFMVQGHKFVIEQMTFTDDGMITGVKVKDGPKFGTHILDGTEVIHFDKGTLKTEANAVGAGAGDPFSVNKATLPRKISDDSPPDISGDQPVALTDIRKYLSKALDIPVRMRRFNQRAYGIFKIRPETIRLKMEDDISTLAHEVGHYLHYILFPKGGGADAFAKRFDSELMPLGQVTSRPSYSPHQVRKEGVAEHLREWMTDRQQALIKAPKFTAFYEAALKKNHPEVWNIVQHARHMLGKYIRQPAEMKIRSMIDREHNRTRMDPMAFTRKLYDNWVNELAPMERASNYLESLGLPRPIARSFSDYAVNYMGGWRGKVEHSMYHRQIDLAGNDVGPPLREILAGIDDIESFEAYLIAKRALEKNRQGIHTGLTTEDARPVVQFLGGRYESHRKQLLKWQRNNRNLLVDSGVLSHKEALAMDRMNANYVPFYRSVEGLGSGTSGAGSEGFVNLGKGVHRMKGSGLQILPPLESIIKNAYVFRDLAERNQVAGLFADAVDMAKGGGRIGEEIARKIKPVEVKHDEVVAELKRHGLDTAALGIDDMNLAFKVWRLAKQQSARDGIFTVYRDGKEQPYQVGDAELFRALQLADAADAKMFNKFPGLKLARGFTRVLRAGSTLTLEFMARNPFRDQVTAGVFSNHGFVPFFDGFKGIMSAIKKDGYYWDWIKSGGRYADFVSVDRTGMRDSLSDVIKEPKALQQAMEWANPKNVIQNLQRISEFMEMGTRISEFKLAKKAGASDMAAANASKDVTLNFARAGFLGKAINQLSAFYNANIQDFDKFARAHKEHPFRTASKAFMYVTLPSLALWYLGKDDPAMQNLPGWRKNFFWNVNMKPLLQVTNPAAGDFIMSFPKPFLLGQLYGSSVERGLDYASKRDPNAVNKWFKEFVGNSPANPWNFLPTMAKPVLDVANNRDSFRDAPIENQSQQQLPSNLRFDAQTSQFARSLSDMLPFDGLSPLKIDHLTRGYLGGLGRYGTDAIDWFALRAGVAEIPPPPEKTMWELPLLRGFVGSPYQANEYTRRFYDGVKKAEERFAALRIAPERMDAKDQQQYLQGNAAQLAFYLAQVDGRRKITELREARTQLGEVLSAMQSIQMSKTMEPSTKRERLIDLTKARNAMAEAYFKTLLSPTDQEAVF